MSNKNIETNINQEKNNSTSVFTLIKKDNGIVHLIINVVEDSINTLKEEFADQIEELLEEIKSDTSIKGIILFSGKEDSFIAGADINMINNCQTKAEVETISRRGQMIFSKIEQFHIPIIAAINGTCLGGGLELVLACHARICTNNPKTVLGLPEVQLGLLPGSGGTQRLPKLIGLQKSLDMMLTGKQIRATQALKIGLVNKIVPNSILIDTAEKMLISGQLNTNNKIKNSLVNKLLEETAIGRNLIFKKAKESVLFKTKGNYPAPIKIIESVKVGIEKTQEEGYKVEANNFAELTMSSESYQLRHIFFATTEMKKEQGVNHVTAKKINKVGVLGGGLMGGGIAFVTATKAKIPVRIKDITQQGISHAFKYGFDLLNKKVKRKFMSKSDLQKQMSNITGCIDFSGFKDVDLVIEAVFEDLKLKQQMVTDIENNTNESTIFASNTSSLPISNIAANAEKPENIIGLHYFSPVDKMPLVEIIPHTSTSDETVSITVAFAKKQGKTPIVVKDKAGFYVNRILAPYMNEAAILLLSGEPIEKIDEALVNFGFPIGPIQLLDEVGIDVGAKIGPVLESKLGKRFSTPSAFTSLLEDGRLGKKVSKGFYLYNTKKKKNNKQVDKSIYSLLNITISNTLPSEEIAKRCTFMMLNEAARCLDEGVVRNARDADIGAIFGIGFPPFLGGPLRYIDSIGVECVIKQLTLWSKQYGERYAPCDALITMAEKNERYY